MQRMKTRLEQNSSISIDEKKSTPSISIDDIIKVAAATFKPGHIIRRAMRDNLSKINKSKLDKEKTVYYDGTQFSPKPSLLFKKITNVEIYDEYVNVRFPRHEDPKFTIDANRIEGTHFIAAAGPQDDTDLGPFFANTVFHATMPTRKIIALGTTLAHGHEDFFDYCLEPRINSSYGNYELTIEKDKHTLIIQ